MGQKEFKSITKEQAEDYSKKLNISVEELREIEKHYQLCYSQETAAPNKEVFMRSFENYFHKDSEWKDQQNEFLSQIFDLFDTDHDGVISFEEFLIGNVMLKLKDPNISLANLFNIIDIDKNGLLDATEIENIFKAARPVFEYEYEYTPYEDTVALMKKLEMKKDEKISKETFIHCLINDTNFSRYFKKLRLLNGIKPSQIDKVSF